MSIGDVTNPKRVRLQANERLDTVDTDPLSLAAREHLDAYSRAVEATPRNVGSSTPTGLIIQGFGLTLNPINPTDGKVRVQSALGVAFDANGRLLIKEAGVTQDLTLSVGNSQIYVYYLDIASDTAVRRSISVGSPYTESPSAISTKFTAGVGFFVRAGDQTSIVASDVVNGATTALCFLGVANNAGGVITMTGYDPVSAPNGSFTTNRFTSVVTPTTLPPGNAGSGSVATVHGLINAALYMNAQTMWKGSNEFVPGAANNFGAYTPPATGVAANLRASTVTLSSTMGSVANSSTRPDFGGDDGAVPSALWAYCVTPGAAFLRNGSANNRVQVAPGELLQSDGVHQELLRFRFQGTEEFPALTNGDATNPRCDLLQMRITFDPLQGWLVQLATKVGTAAASPTIPDPDAGFVPVGVAVVGATWAAGNAPSFGDLLAPFVNKVKILDVRMPLGIRTYVVDPVGYKLDTAWALTNQNQFVTSSNATNLFIVRAPTTVGRLVGIDGPFSITSFSGCSIGSWSPNIAPGTSPGIGFTPYNGFGTNTANSGVTPRSRRFDFEQLHTAVSGLTIQASAVNKIGVPIWMSGWRTPQISTGQIPVNVALRVQNLPSGTLYAETTFYVAQGL